MPSGDALNTGGPSPDKNTGLATKPLRHIGGVKQGNSNGGDKPNTQSNVGTNPSSGSDNALSVAAAANAVVHEPLKSVPDLVEHNEQTKVTAPIASEAPRPENSKIPEVKHSKHYTKPNSENVQHDSQEHSSIFTPENQKERSAKQSNNKNRNTGTDPESVPRTSSEKANPKLDEHSKNHEISKNKPQLEAEATSNNDNIPQPKAESVVRGAGDFATTTRIYESLSNDAPKKTRTEHSRMPHAKDSSQPESENPIHDRSEQSPKEKPKERSLKQNSEIIGTDLDLQNDPKQSMQEDKAENRPPITETSKTSKDEETNPPNAQIQRKAPSFKAESKITGAQASIATDAEKNVTFIGSKLPQSTIDQQLPSAANDSQGDNEATNSDDAETAATKAKKSRRKSKSARSSLDSNRVKFPIEVDTETVEIKQRIKQFSKDIRSATDAGKSQNESSAAKDDNPVTTSRRLSADATAFIPVIKGAPATTSSLPPTALNAPEFVPSSRSSNLPSSKRSLPRPKSVKDMISKFDGRRKDMANQSAKSENPTTETSNRSGSDKNSPEKPSDEISQKKRTDAASKSPSETKTPNPNPQPSAALQARIQQYQTGTAISSEQAVNHPVENHATPKNITIAALDHINLDVNEEEVLEAPSPSVQLVKKPTSEPNDKGIRSRIQGQQRQQSQEPTNPDPAAENKSPKPVPTEIKDSIENTLRKKVTNEVVKSKPFTSRDSSNAPLEVEKPEGSAKEQPQKLQKIQLDTREKTDKESEARDNKNKESQGEKSNKESEVKEKESEIKLQADSKPASSVAVTDPQHGREQEPKPQQKPKTCCVII